MGGGFATAVGVGLQFLVVSVVVGWFRLFQWQWLFRDTIYSVGSSFWSMVSFLLFLRFHGFFPFNVIVSIGTKYFDDWHVVGRLGLDGGWVGFWVCSRWRERERERDLNQIRERYCFGIYILLHKYIILMYCIWK